MLDQQAGEGEDALLEIRIADELQVRPDQVQAAIQLLDEGATVPFIARYRKELTQGLDDTQLRRLEERLRYMRELDERRAAVLASIEEQGKLSISKERCSFTSEWLPNKS